MNTNTIKRATILVTGRKTQIMEAVTAELEASSFEVLQAIDNSATETHIMKSDFNLLFIGGGIDPTSRMEFQRLISIYKPNVKVVEVSFGLSSSITELVEKSLGI